MKAVVIEVRELEKILKGQADLDLLERVREARIKAHDARPSSTELVMFWTFSDEQAAGFKSLSLEVSGDFK